MREEECLYECEVIVLWELACVLTEGQLGIAYADDECGGRGKRRTRERAKIYCSDGLGWPA